MTSETNNFAYEVKVNLGLKVLNQMSRGLN